LCGVSGRAGAPQRYR